MLFLVAPVAETLRSPTATFVLLLAITLLIPPVFERIKLPGLVGLLAVGQPIINEVERLWDKE